MRKLGLVIACLALTACGESHVASDAGGLDSGARDSGPSDSGSGDSGSADAGPAADAGPVGCDPQDATEGVMCAPDELPGLRYRWDGTACEAVYWCRCEGADCDALFADEAACMSAYAACFDSCSSDADCASGSAWCEGGRCVPCDNGGLLCDIACADGWATYMRNGCSPCACAPTNECVDDSDCASSGGGAQHCYAGAFCWCSGGDPSCCMGNVCSPAGCTEPPPMGCRTRGCPRGEACRTDMGCASSGCGCDSSSSSWGCLPDCGGGVCVAE